MWTKMSSVPSPRVRKPKPRSTIEPFDDDDLEAAGRRHLHMRARHGLLRGMHGRRFVHRHDAEHLQPLGRCCASQTMRAPSGAVWNPSRLQHRDVQQHVGAAVVGT
jgi:hypothetical protein